VDAANAARSHIVSPQILPELRGKFPTLIGDVATTGNSGSGVPKHKCLLGIMSRKFICFPSGAGADNCAERWRAYYDRPCYVWKE
jgi:hypothetical protein